MINKNGSARVLGIYRELQNSPNRESDDALILKAVAAELSSRGIATTLATPEEADGMDLGDWDAIVPMCESYPRLMRLLEAAQRDGARAINPAASVLNCYRLKMVELLSKTAGVSLPTTETRRVSSGAAMRAPSFDTGSGLWVKRGDVHNTCLRDVVFARDWSAVEPIREDFESREIQDLVLQTHIDGDLIKFYGAGPGEWFTWFYHDPETARRLPFDAAELASQASAAAAAVGLGIFGGDAIISMESRIYLIDINSWPSFARVRAEAARRIALHIDGVLRRTAALGNP